MNKHRKPIKSPPISSEVRARDFARIREDHRNELTEDYVELICDLAKHQPEVRAVDIAEYLGVSQPTVNKTIKRLIEEGLVASAPYRAIYLTEKGEALALKSKHRHELVVQCLIALGVSESTAQRDAEGIEHHISEETLSAIERQFGVGE